MDRPLNVTALVALGVLSIALTGCATTVPSKQGNLCAIFEQHPKWYGYAGKSEKTWGTPKHIQFAFIRQESSFRANAKPPFRWFLFIPLGRASSAKGYAQAQNPVWSEYERERGSLLRSRSDMKDALDFVGWYNHKSHRRLGLSKRNTRALYLAYHEGHAGYRRGSYQKKAWLVRVADRVAANARRYEAQLNQCEAKFRRRGIWPFG